MTVKISSACVVALIAVSGCAAFRAQINPAVYRAKKVALVGYYGPAKMISTGGGLVSAIQSETNQFGVSVAEKTIDEVYSRLQDVLKVELLPLQSAPEHAGYAAAPLIRFNPGFYFAPRGMKPLSVDARDDGALGKLAGALGVDAVIVLKNTWSIDLEGASHQPVGTNRLEVLIVAADGTRLYDATGMRGYAARGSADTSFATQLAAGQGAMTEELALKLSRAALRASLDKFLDHWGVTQ
jgi:hypothetical protein